MRLPCNEENKLEINDFSFLVKKCGQAVAADLVGWPFGLVLVSHQVKFGPTKCRSRVSVCNVYYIETLFVRNWSWPFSYGHHEDSFPAGSPSFVNLSHSDL